MFINLKYNIIHEVSKVKALGYARVSLENENVENQIHSIEEYAKANGLELLKVFQDIGVSGSKPALEREGFKQLYEVSRALGVKTLIVFDLTRLGRDLFDLIETYKKLLEEGFTVLFVKHPELNAKPESPIGEALRKALLTILGVVAELERAFIRERTLTGLERVRKEGVRLGRKPVDIPLDLVRKYRKKGLSKKAIYTVLVSQGYLKYVEKGYTKTLSYDRFLKRLKALGVE